MSVSREQIKEQIESIKNATETIRIAIEQMPDCGAKKSFGVTYQAMQKKVDKYSQERAERFHLSDEEKALILKHREQSAQESVISQIFTDGDSESGNDGVTEQEGKKRKKGRHE